MFIQLLVLAGAALVAIAAALALFLLGMRAKSPLVMKPVIWLSRAFMNPMQMRTAGTPGAYASVIRHRGRVSGKPYETPVGVLAVDDDFLITLPYGTSAQWLRNVLAAGSATLVTEGRTVEVDRPQLVPMAAVEAHFPANEIRSARLFRVDQCLRLHRAGVAAAESPSARAA